MDEVDKGIESSFGMELSSFGSLGTIYKDGHFIIQKSSSMPPMGHFGIRTIRIIYEYNNNMLKLKKLSLPQVYFPQQQYIKEPYHFITILNNSQINIIFNLLMKMFEPADFFQMDLDNISKIKLLDEYWYSEQQKSKENIEELTTKYELQIKQLQDENELLKTKSVQSSQIRTQSHRRTHSANRAPERRTPSRQALSRKVTNRRSTNRTSSNARRTSKGYSV